MSGIDVQCKGKEREKGGGKGVRWCPGARRASIKCQIGCDDSRARCLSGCTWEPLGGRGGDPKMHIFYDERQAFPYSNLILRAVSSLEAWPSALLLNTDNI